MEACQETLHLVKCEGLPHADLQPYPVYQAGQRPHPDTVCSHLEPAPVYGVRAIRALSEPADLCLQRSVSHFQLPALKVVRVQIAKLPMELHVESGSTPF